MAATVLAMVLEAIFQLGPRVYDETGALTNPDTWQLTVPALPSSITNTPDLGILGQFNLLGSFEKLGIITASLFVFSLLLADFFDTMGTVVAIGTEAELLDEDGNPPHTDRILVVDSVAAIAGGAGGVSSNTSYIESASGVEEGARTGLASVVTGVLFLLATFLAPLFAVVPSEAAAPALVIVGFLMMTQVTNIDWNDMEVALPAFLTIVLMPFTYNITVGIGAGFIAWVLLKIAKGTRLASTRCCGSSPVSSSSTSSRPARVAARRLTPSPYAVRPSPSREGVSRVCWVRDSPGLRWTAKSLA